MSILRDLPSRTPNPEIRWEQIPSFPGYYASSDGRIRGRRGKELSQSDDGYGYLKVCIVTGRGFKSDGKYVKRRVVRVNRMVCEAFHGVAPSETHQAAHEDCDRKNNCESNLSWQTQPQNMSNPVTRQRLSASRASR